MEELGSINHLDNEHLRIKFINRFGAEMYRKFVLGLYGSFPLRENLFYWQEKLLADLMGEIKVGSIQSNEVYSIFDQCPVHHVQLQNDTVKIVDGTTYQTILPYGEVLELFPMAHVDAPRNTDMFSYPETVEVLYCSKCREVRNSVGR